jgi:integration host factor subunit alpha
MSTTIKNLVDAVHETHSDLGLTKQSIADVIDSVLETVSQSLLNGEDVVLRNFGRIYVKTKPARLARNPRTGDPVNVPEKQVIKFAPRGTMKESL